MTGRVLARQLEISESYLSEIVHNKRKATAIRERLIRVFGFPRSVVETAGQRRTRLKSGAERVA
jgi:plasmid maintenance system antidote protein VapI